MKNTNKFDFIFLGNGASSALVLIELKTKNLLHTSRILIIEPLIGQSKNKNFCFWANPEDSIVTELSYLIEHTWTEIEINQNQAEELNPLRYYHISNRNIQNHIKEITATENIQYIFPEVSSISIDTEGEFIQIENQKYYSSNILDSRTPSFQKTEQHETLIFQSFIGWEVKLHKEIINTNSFKMMDFEIDQNNSTQFVYLLPLSSDTALIEFTRFGENTITQDEAEQTLNAYITEHLGEFKKISVEQGCIPMSNCNLDFQKNKSLTQLGARNYCVKPSTGYALKTMHSQSKKIVRLFEERKPTRLNNIYHKEATSGRFAFYDALLLIILMRWPSQGKEIFTQLFARVDTKTILNFLDEKTTLREEIGIFKKLPIGIFLRALLIRVTLNPFFRTFCLLLLTLLLIGLNSHPFVQSIIGYSVLLVGMIAVGLPHGAVDHLISSKGLNTQITPKFILTYLGLMTVMGILWFIFPNATLLAFLIFSAFHFGQADIKSWELNQNKSMLWGLCILLFILGTHLPETNEILASMSSLTIPFSIGPIFLAPWFVYAILKKKKNMLLTLVWILLTSQLPLILAFGIYFIGQHSLISWKQLTNYLEMKSKAVWLKSLPFQLGAWIILVLFYLAENHSYTFSSSYFMNTSNKWGVFFIFISCISMPHSIYMNNIYVKNTEPS